MTYSFLEDGYRSAGLRGCLSDLVYFFEIETPHPPLPKAQLRWITGWPTRLLRGQYTIDLSNIRNCLRHHAAFTGTMMSDFVSSLSRGFTRVVYRDSVPAIKSDMFNISNLKFTWRFHVRV